MHGAPPIAWPLYPSGVASLDRPGYFSPESVKHWPEGRVFYNVTNVTLTPYLVDSGHPLFTGASVIVAPGGAYKWITWDAEGTDIAAWLNSIGTPRQNTPCRAHATHAHATHAACTRGIREYSNVRILHAAHTPHATQALGGDNCVEVAIRGGEAG